MTDVTADNFQTLRPVVEDLIANCSFMSIDTEFTGLTVSKETENSLFDSVDERYQKIRNNVRKFTILQCGLAVFVSDKNRQANAYTVHCFNFNVFMRGNSAVEECFLVQPSAVEFLVQNAFNFQTVFSRGIPYLNHDQEAGFVEELKNRHERSSKSAIQLSSLCDEDRKELDSLLSACKTQVSSEEKWSKFHLPYKGGLPAYMVCQYLMSELPSVTCTSSGSDTLTVQPTPEAVLTQMKTAKTEHTVDINKELEAAIGFGHIFRCMVKSKKPLVGHNMLLDLAFLYQKFYRSLPESYSTFKRELHQLFPVVIDTKRLCFSLRNVLSECGGNLLFKTHLEGLYTTIASKKTAYMKLNAPVVSHAKEQMKYKNKTTYFHEAAFDAYACGFVFLRMAHMAVSQGVKMTQPLPFSEYILKLSSHFNFIHVIKGPIYALNLAGEDPPSPRPPWLVVRHRFNSHLTNREALSLIQCFKGLDYKEIGQGRNWCLWAAAPTTGMASDMCSLGVHPQLKVRWYSWWLDTPTGWRITRLTAIGSLVIMGLVGWLFNILTK
jgi:DNA-directed RNA polymerase subunit F